MDKALREHLGRVVRENRERLGLSQEKLGQLIGGATHNTISNIERGRTVPSLYRLSALSKVLGVPIWRFVTNEPLVVGGDGLTSIELKLLQVAQSIKLGDLQKLVRIAEVFSESVNQSAEAANS